MQKNRNEIPDPTRKGRPIKKTTLQEIKNAEVPESDENRSPAPTAAIIEPSGEERKLVTNHDEQNKTTNAQDSNNAIEEKETEGI